MSNYLIRNVFNVLCTSLNISHGTVTVVKINIFRFHKGREMKLSVQSHILIFYAIIIISKQFAQNEHMPTKTD